MNFIKRKALAVFENKLLKHGSVLEVRAWNPATFFEIDLHLPMTNMEKWSSVQHIKVKVAEGTYRDYTPTLFDAETQTCTLCIDCAHDGVGSKWVASLKKGDLLPYIGIGSTFHKPIPGKRLLCLGDSSSVGHFLALKQLTEISSEIYGAMSFQKQSHADEFSAYFETNFDSVKQDGWNYSLIKWLENQVLGDETIYIAGHIPTAIELRKYLTKRQDFTGTIKVQGFWK